MILNIDSQDPKPVIGVYSFGAKGGKSPVTQFECDVTEWRDPAGQKQFKKVNGTHPDVRGWMKEDKRVQAVINHCLLLADDLVKPKSREVGETTQVEALSGWLSFSFKDHHGKWAAPAVAELVARALSNAGYFVGVRHVNLDQKEIFGADAR